MVVAKLRGARERKRRTNASGKCEGRKSHAERPGGQELIALARQLRRPDPDRRPVSLTKVAAQLAERGFVARSGLPYSSSAIASILRS